jgi:ankyrin repeat protein
MYASWKGHSCIVSLLLSLGAEVDRVHRVRFIVYPLQQFRYFELMLFQNSWTSLHWACSRRHIAIAQMLIQNGANVDIQDTVTLLTSVKVFRLIDINANSVREACL